MGYTEYYFDLLYIQYLVQIGTLFSPWMWLLYLIIPTYAIYKLGSLAYRFLFSGMSGLGGLGGLMDMKKQLSQMQQQQNDPNYGLSRSERRKQRKDDKKGN